MQKQFDIVEGGVAKEVMHRGFLSNVSVNQKAVLLAVAKDRNVTNPTSGSFIKQHSLPSASSVQRALGILLKNGFIVKNKPSGLMIHYSVSSSTISIQFRNSYKAPSHKLLNLNLSLQKQNYHN